ncbi:MAG: hypothetical protein IPN26_13265 [Bacteroidetes bacterium]|nr:hypothetical protein [Bacteroidota bacterium]
MLLVTMDLVTVASPVFINILPPTQCYCTPTYSSGTGGGDFCQQVEIPGTTLLNNSGPSTTPFYTLFPQSEVRLVLSMRINFIP